MTTTPIRALLFDFGGVLAEEGFRNGLRTLAVEQDLDPDTLPGQGMQAVYDSGFVLGKGSVSDFWDLLRQRTGLAGDDHSLSERILAGFVVRPAMIDQVRRWRGHGLVTAILSDQTHWLDELDRRYGFYDAFDRIYNSYYLGKGKRDPSLFADVAADLGLPPAALLFIDDDPGNVERARRAGLQAIRFIDQDDCSTAIEALLD
jgi:putative hydrolase of the HAD superfamily